VKPTHAECWRALLKMAPGQAPGQVSPGGGVGGSPRCRFVAPGRATKDEHGGGGGEGRALRDAVLNESAFAQGPQGVLLAFQRRLALITGRPEVEPVGPAGTG
jgi:hypothetical protein